MTTPTPAPESLRSDVAQQLEEVLAMEAGTWRHVYHFEFVRDNAPTLRRALAALTELESVKQELAQLREALEKARKRFIVWGSAEGYVTDDEDDAEFARCGFRATAATSLLAEAVRESYAEGDDDEETELRCETVLIIPADAVEVSRGE